MRNFTVKSSLKLIRYEQCSKQKKGLHKFSRYEILRPLYIVFSRLRQGERASLTLEAAMSVPLFMMFCISLISFLVILNLQINIQISMEEASRSIGKTAYAIEHASSVKDKNSDSTDQQSLTLMSLGINPTTVKMYLFSDSGLSPLISKSRIKGGTSGLYTYNSTFDEADGILDIVTSYDYQVPWLPSGWGTLRLVQRMRSHVWIGESLEKNSNGSPEKNENQTVYVTPTGSVYHLSASCHYLDLSIHSVSYSELSQKRNSSGSKYDRCAECAASGEFDNVYITNYGTNWHSSLSCSGLKRTVIEHDISEVEGMRACLKCKAQDTDK